MNEIKKLEIYFHNGKPDGIRTIRQHLSAITAYVVPRHLLSEAKKLEGITRPGVYYLICESDDNAITRLYVGQTRNGIDRLDNHVRTKSFWNKAILFLADDSTFSLDMISGLEEYAIEKAKRSNRYKVENKVSPKYKISSYDLPFIERIYDEIKFVMASQGYNLERIEVKNPDPNIVMPTVFHTTRNKVLAYGAFDGDKFLVVATSQIDLSRACFSEKIEAQRQAALADGIIKEENGKYILKISKSFTSPSSAACFVLGGSANGWTEWKNHRGQTLDEIYRN
ncbi:MAG: GIY-YIG nuclease family protein [Ruminococcus flavefaciens]|nr:GIY-YIG nuclease family protein [Ruminococcus flavefaciens]